MATNFPAALDDFINYVDGKTIFEALTLNDMQFAIEALQAKVGVDGSGIPTSHDYKITTLESAGFGAYTNKDDDEVTILKSHAYLANQDGFVVAQMTATTIISIENKILSSMQCTFTSVRQHIFSQSVRHIFFMA